MESPALLAAVLAVGYAALGGVDGLIMHLWRYRLHRTAQGEHRIHTARALLMPPILLLFVTASATGAWLWVGVACVLVDLALVVWDAGLEPTSRAFQGGLSNFEAALHMVLHTLHVLMLACAVTYHPELWPFAGAASPVAPDPLADLLVGLVFVGSLGYAGLHVLLLVRPLAWSAGRPA